MNIKSALKEVIAYSNLRNLSDIIRDHDYIPYFIQNNRYFVNFAYTYNNFKAAEIQISNGAVFDVRSLFLADQLSCENLKHIDDIKNFITSTQYLAATNLIKAYKCNDNATAVIINNTTCIDIAQYLADHTISNFNNKSYIVDYYRGMTNLSSPLAKEILSGIVGVTYNLHAHFIIMPVGTKTYFDSVSIHQENKLDLIYLPTNNGDKVEYSYSFHELMHYLLDALPGFKGKAYYDDISMKSYEKAAKATLLNAFSILRLVANKQEAIDDENVTVKIVIDYLSNSTEINRFTYLSNPDNDYRTELLFNNYIGNITVPILNKKIVFDNFLNSYMQRTNVTQDAAYLLSRIGECIKRPADEWPIELVVRLVELEAYGLDSEVIKIFDPMRDYIQNYIIPRIKEVTRTLPVPFCDQIKSDEISTSGDMFSAENQQNITTIGDNGNLDQDL